MSRMKARVFTIEELTRMGACEEAREIIRRYLSGKIRFSQRGLQRYKAIRNKCSSPKEKREAEEQGYPSVFHQDVRWFLGEYYLRGSMDARRKVASELSEYLNTHYTHYLLYEETTFPYYVDSPVIVKNLPTATLIKLVIQFQQRLEELQLEEYSNVWKLTFRGS